MTLFDLRNIKKYSPGDDTFLNKAILLFKNELVNFIETYKDVQNLEKLDDLKMRIHKLKPSCELFDIPSNIQARLAELFDSDLDDFENEIKIITILAELNLFFTHLITEFEDYLNPKNQNLPS